MYAISALLVSFAAVLFGQSVSAITPYDAIVHPTDELVIRSSDGVHERDITESLLQTMQQNCSSTYYDSFVDTLADTNGTRPVAGRSDTMDG